MTKKLRTFLVYPVATPRYAELEYNDSTRLFQIEVHETADPMSGVEFRVSGSTPDEAMERLKEHTPGFEERKFSGSTKHAPNWNLVADCTLPPDVVER